ncbi:ATP-binding cassette domain-containing protein [Nesterenkonia sp. PF2B19]|uniref:ATP-binding cassette domain-containing protein n=1 Tax=Nesterenkonia sp. PF2B19 TaxID=1881858 RepID=UPI001EFF8426|nr:ATP-binding cassette domain-containing protein [Nesterenkonia sp. PF2B19]
MRASAARIAELTEQSRPEEIPADDGDDDGDDAGAVAVAGAPPAVGVLLELEGVTVRWPGQQVATAGPVDLRLAPGERALVTGPSGSGKSALAQALVRLLEHEAHAGWTVWRSVSCLRPRCGVGCV